MQSKNLACLSHRLLAIGNLINRRSGSIKIKKASSIKLDSLLKTAKKYKYDANAQIACDLNFIFYVLLLF